MSDRTAVEYHWIITLTGTLGPERTQVTVGDRGTVTHIPANTTRAQICDELVASIKDAVLARTGMLLEEPNIVCFQLEPNQL
ncbi:MULTISPECIES: hypothetical protein [Streptomyces]|uniref:hypothetical protein n=1 Tax=Streptomyces TaxID=1883 RepID=UPI00073DDA6A|nr:hypothetical protein [Streptomyces sp. FBKL.4005]OYP10225.1 hypothetical protein CFC35_41245 [Streptomyces sp. FBKL.4005]CUW33386.1 hypothetical protein TUE45_pSRTUE45a_0018 [Streptomyces reticuli]